MFQVVLVHPQIPPNTGQIARLCAATGASLHLVRPLGFRLNDRSLRRAGLDYWRLVDVMTMNNLSWPTGVCLKGRKAIAWGNAPGRPVAIRS
ncbi:hypothetical protein FJY63_11330, partial [Candidatus Sumerlaeota bacterium]|nr:hypothetical protein [Candidatus Sumerlaeota bacterium]